VPFAYLGANTIRWPDPVQGPWRVTFHFAAVDGDARCVGVDVRGFRADVIERDHDLVDPANPPPPLTTSLLQRLQLGRLMDEARADLVALRRHVAAAADDIESRIQLAAEQAAGTPERAGRRRLTPDFLAAVAATYARAYLEGESPTEAVASRYGVPRSTAGKWVMRARRDGLLGATTERRAGGVAPPEAVPPGGGMVT